MMAAALVGCSFFLQELGQPAKDSVLSSAGLRDKVFTVVKEETEIGFVLFQRPISYFKFAAVERKLQFLHGVVLKFKLFILGAFFNFSALHLSQPTCFYIALFTC